MPNAEHIGHRIAAAMKEKGVGPTEVAHAFKVKPPSVHDWTTTGRIAKKHITGLVEYFGKPVEWWLNGTTGSALHAAEPRPIYAVTPPPSIRSTIAALGDALDLCTEDNRKAVASLLAQYAVNPKPGGVADAIVMLLERCAVPTADNPYPNATPTAASKRSGAKP
jgi:plasmid maintenance system antidote protein VapI